MSQSSKSSNCTSESSQSQTCSRHDFGWSLQLRRCGDCGVITRNRGCNICCSRFCRGCFALHTCPQACITSGRGGVSDVLGIESREDEWESTQKALATSTCITMEELTKLLEKWDAQCDQERFNNACNRASDMVQHATQLHCQHADLFGDIMVRAQACQFLLHSDGSEEARTKLEASGALCDIELELDILCDEALVLEGEIHHRKPLSSAFSSICSGATDASTKASTGVNSTTSEVAMWHSHENG